MAGWAELEVQNTEDMFSKLFSLGAPNSFRVFRGQNNATYDLVPSIDRGVAISTCYEKRRLEEDSLMEAFLRSTKHMLTDTEQMFVDAQNKSGKFGLMSVMQHHGAPTRLLDWTRSPFVAAFFACLGSQRSDGKIWWFSYREYEKAASNDRFSRVLGRPLTELEPSDGTAKEIFEHVFRQNPISFIRTLYFDLGAAFEKAEAQHGLFTIAGKLGECHDRLLADLLPQGSFGAVVIPRGKKEEVIERLRTLNITSKTISYSGADEAAFRIGLELKHLRSDNKLFELSAD